MRKVCAFPLFDQSTIHLFCDYSFFFFFLYLVATFQFCFCLYDEYLCTEYTL